MLLVPGGRCSLGLVVAATGLLLLGSMLLYSDASRQQAVIDVLQPYWSYASGLTRFDFQPTPLEQACFNGTAARINAPGLPETIPPIVHFITGVDEPNPVSIVTWLAVRAVVAQMGPGVEIRLHHVHLSQEGPWWPDVRKRVKLVRHQPEFLADFASTVPPPSQWRAAHKADVLRLQILRREGGIYLDTDVVLLRPLDALLSGRRDIVMAYEGGNRQGLCNGVILAKPGAPFVERWYRMYRDFDPTDWNYHSVLLPAKLAVQYPDDICPLSPAAFFWPLWTKDQVALMHRPLDASEAARVTEAMSRNHGALYPGQLAYHATGFKKHMTSATAHDILTQDTRFNLLVRRYVNMEYNTSHLLLH
ncbi:hypothetical protein CDD81_2476 [Ophiocordyceps australis]|uniref:Alpha 1,4-glycosyltransferase domain-containing protein n=1 Tax=Ophiocordyceps australis TaxID=1399860 RepID=A0A2C5YDL2_9HYPO|nr:hypothetical protein CDD81_2476 [Ophiocordyceps australis]